MVQIVSILLTEVNIVLVQFQMMRFINLWSIVKHLFLRPYLLIRQVHSILIFCQHFLIMHGLMYPTVHDVVTIVADRAISSLG